MDDFKRGLPGVGTDSFMSDWMCNFCGQKMDDYAETFPDGEYTRTIGYRCINKECPGPPKMVRKELLDAAMELIEACAPTMAGSAYDTLFLKDHEELINKIKKG